MTTLMKTKKQNKTKQNKKQKTKQNKTKQNKTKNTRGGSFGEEYTFFDKLAKTMKENTRERFIIKAFDNDATTNDGMIEVGEITFSLADVILKENDEDGKYTINQKIMHKSGRPYKSVNLEMPEDAEIRFHYKSDKNSNISIYDKNTDDIVSAIVILKRPFSQIVKTAARNTIDSVKRRINSDSSI